MSHPTKYFDQVYLKSDMDLASLFILHQFVVLIYFCCNADSSYPSNKHQLGSDIARSVNLHLNMRRSIPHGSKLPQESNMTQGFSIEYTLITANSPDCESSLADNYPVRVQYGVTSGNENRSINEWRSSPFVPTLIPG